MFALRNLILAIAEILNWTITIYIWMLIARALLSWVQPNPYNPIVRFLDGVTEPLLAPIRYFLFRRFTTTPMIDLSPLVLILLLYLIQRFSIPTLIELAYRLQ